MNQKQRFHICLASRLGNISTLDGIKLMSTWIRHTPFVAFAKRCCSYVPRHRRIQHSFTVLGRVCVFCVCVYISGSVCTYCTRMEDKYSWTLSTTYVTAAASSSLHNSVYFVIVLCFTDSTVYNNSWLSIPDVFFFFFFAIFFLAIKDWALGLLLCHLENLWLHVATITVHVRLSTHLGITR